MEFYAKVVQLYGNEACDPNLHLHGHLYECVNDYGPVYSFWLFAFERLNGILGSYHTNCRNISLQLTRRFLDSKTYAVCNWPEEFKDKFAPLLEEFKYQKGSLQQSSFGEAFEVRSLPPVQENAFSPVELAAVNNLAMSLYPRESLTVPMLYNKCKSVQLNGFTIGSKPLQLVTCLSQTRRKYLYSGTLSDNIFFGMQTYKVIRV